MQTNRKLVMVLMTVSEMTGANTPSEITIYCNAVLDQTGKNDKFDSNRLSSCSEEQVNTSDELMEQDEISGNEFQEKQIDNSVAERVSNFITEN